MYIDTWKKKDNFFSEINESKYNIAKGCWFFHDEVEFNQFDDIDDDPEELEEIYEPDDDDIIKSLNNSNDDERLEDYL
ncbi:MAG: hypothetical protein ACFFCI_15995 [Promethearchaeota archaeon]